MSTFHKIAQEVVETSDETDPTKLATEFISRMEQEYRTAMSEFLDYAARGYIREVIRAGRSRNMIPSEGGYRNPANPITRQTGLAWKKILSQREYVPSIGEWVRLAEATIEQVREMASYRYQIADRNRHRAELYEKLAKTMDDRGAGRVEDLSPAVLTVVFTEGNDS